ncbi:MAG: sulfite exporter TauE/SafE family protein [Nitrospinaceae bacterium]|nr:sulfite exporter TauE/SafE family protein [Nitrospinaceae bacterium]MBT3433432.1 sulfite exporter TauE/SafE family protein [Nitrospinaceae bacterium]MBT3821631.1 sulfite exporter TauE/SafE family protein [Nitrospinaceae bacterium]MBT4092904.1 sulfite exporter TauE/SafE family protein [Nitrospinaceae bacterium]MBT4431442.1 sulfite exporter TauE/SafE family protein [Nitrospinaceae bacterium]
MSGYEWAATVAILAAGGLLKGAIGFGLPVFANSFLFLFMAPQKVVVLMSVPVLVTNLLNVQTGWKEWRNLRHVLPYFIAGAATVPAGVIFLNETNPDVIRIFLAGVVFFYLAMHRRLPAMDSFGVGTRTAIGLVCGLAVGFTMGATGITGPVHGVYLTMFLWPKDVFVFVINAFNVLTAGTLAGSLASHGKYTTQVFWEIGLALIPVMAGFSAGVRIRDRIPQEIFYRVVRGVLFLIGLILVGRSILNLS